MSKLTRKQKSVHNSISNKKCKSSSESDCSSESSSENSSDNSSENSSDSSIDSSDENSLENSSDISTESSSDSYDDTVENLRKSIMKLKERKPIIIKWVEPLMKRPKTFKNKIKFVDKITSKYYIEIPFYFTGKPVYCKEWDKHFSSDIIEQIKGIDINSNNFNKHWDLINTSFIFKNINNLPVIEIDKYIDNNQYLNDIKIAIDNDITLILKSICYEKLIEYKEKCNDKENIYNIVSNIQFITHFKEQSNIYKNKECNNPDKAWLLHLILNEQQIKIFDTKISCTSKYDFKLKVLNIKDLYKCLYLYYINI